MVSMKQASQRAGLLLVVAFGASLIGCAELGGPDVAGELGEAIIDGEINEDDVAVVALTVNGHYNAFCSGTLISPTVVLTAAHCLPPNAETVERIEDVMVRFGTDVYDPFASLAVTEAWIHPAFGENGLEDDIALLRLEDRATVMPIPAALSAPARGDEVRIVGYGITRAEIGGIRRSGTASVAWTGEINILLEPAPSAICFGDSGGPTIASIDGRESVVGVHSHLGTGECGGMGVDTRVDPYLDFLRAFVLESTPTCETDHFCVEGCSPPDEDCPCEADGRCGPECSRPETDPDCLASCDANGVCGEGCGAEDPDCICSADGLCDALCRDDPDCVYPDESCVEDGFCDEDCDDDPDCPSYDVKGGGACATVSTGATRRASLGGLPAMLRGLLLVQR